MKYQTSPLFEQIRSSSAVMWGDALIGFGRYFYVNSQGETRWRLSGFSPRKQNLVIYINAIN